MKLSLVVRTSGSAEGKAIPIKAAKFLIGRDPGCHLRPASVLVSKRHCEIEIDGDKASVQDFGSTNGTFINDQPVKGKAELRHKDMLKVGPLLFEVQLELPPPVNKPTPLPPTRKKRAVNDEEAAALLLSLDDGAPLPPAELDAQGVPMGSTVMQTQVLAPVPAEQAASGANGDQAAVKPEAAPKKNEEASTSKAAQAILEKYLRRPRT